MRNWCYFRVGDIITSFQPGSQWYKKKIKVMAIESINTKLWGASINNSCLSSAGSNLNGLALLERENYIFKVGDEVIVQHSKKIERNLTIGKTGKIIVINPEEGIFFPFLAEFNYFDGGQDGILSWPRAWFPKKYKIPCRSRLWINGNNGIEKYIPS